MAADHAEESENRYAGRTAACDYQGDRTQKNFSIWLWQAKFYNTVVGIDSRVQNWLFRMGPAVQSRSFSVKNRSGPAFLVHEPAADRICRFWIFQFRMSYMICHFSPMRLCSIFTLSFKINLKKKTCSGRKRFKKLHSLSLRQIEQVIFFYNKKYLSV